MATAREFEPNYPERVNSGPMIYRHHDVDPEPAGDGPLPVEVLLPDPDLMGSPDGDIRGLRELQQAAHERTLTEEDRVIEVMVAEIIRAGMITRKGPREIAADVLTYLPFPR